MQSGFIEASAGGGIDAAGKQAAEVAGIPCMFRRPAVLSSILCLCDISIDRSLQQV
jgi:hypothetical protein